jgi:dGTPase
VGAPPEDRAATLEGQIARVADIVAYVNHDIDDAVRAGILEEGALPAGPIALVGRTSSQRISAMVTDIMLQTLDGGLTEVRMSDRVLQATLELREFLFGAVYENPRATSEFEKAAGVLGGLWDKLRARPEPHLDRATIDADGLDVAVRDFLAGMTDRYAVSLFEEMFVPRSWSV